LLNIIGNNDKPNIDCGLSTKAECFNFQQFYKPEGSTEFGARVFATYNPRDLFPGKTPEQANKLWLDVQKDLESNTLLNINTAKEPWNQRILSDLNDQEKVYIINQTASTTELEYMVNVLGYQLRSNLNLKDPNSINAVCGRDLRMLDTDDRDTALNKAYDDMFCKLSSLSKAKVARWSAENNLATATTKDQKIDRQSILNIKVTEQQATKTLFDTANATYIYELKNGALKHKPLVIFTPPPATTPPVVVIDEDAGLDMPTKCAKPKNKALKVCRPYYDPPADCITKKGLLKNTADCEGYKEPTPIIEPPPVVIPPPPPPVVVPPSPKPAPAPTPPKKKK
jgi:hypothetical protein